MSDPGPASTTFGASPAPGAVQPELADEPLGALVHRLSEQLPELIRSEIRLGQAELTRKGKAAGIGVGLFGGAGLVGFLGLCTLIVTAVLALHLALAAWLSALIVAVALLLIAAVLGLVGTKEVTAAVPPAPEKAIAGVKADVATDKGGNS